MSLQTKLTRWQQAGLIDAATSEAIVFFEKTRSPFSFGSALLAIGALAVFLGLAALVASNWAAIPAAAKLAGHAGLNIALGFGVWRCALKNRSAAREVLTFLLAGATLTFIALIGQIYQTNAPLWQAMTLWLACVTPFLFAFGRTRLTVWGWLAGALVTLGAACEPLASVWGRHFLSALSLLPLFALGLTQAPFFRRVPSIWRNNVSATAYVALALAASLGVSVGTHFYWFSATGPLVPASLLQALLLALAGCLLLVLLRRRGLLERQEKTLDLFVGVSFLAALGLPLLAATGLMPSPLSLSAKLLSLVGFIAYWLCAGWVASRCGKRRLLHVATGIVCLRLVIVYFELFGSLALTGAGLVGFGLVLILGVFALRALFKRTLPVQEILP